MRAACEERDAAYGKAFEEDVRALEGVQEKASSSQGEIGDGVVAALGAAMLRVSEREALRSVMEACCSDGEDKRGGGERKRKREEDGNGEA